MRKNKGFTLVELLVAMTVASIVGVAVFSFVIYSSRSFQTSNRNVKLQYEQQTVVTTIKDAILETSRGLYYDEASNCLYILSDSGVEASPCIAKRFKFDPGTYTLSLSEGIQRLDDLSSKKITELGYDQVDQILSDSVKSFSVDTTDIYYGRVSFSITFIIGDREMTVHPEVALRNMITELDNNSDLEEVFENTDEDYFKSLVSRVTILRDGKVLSQGTTDTFAMAGDVTTLDYDAVVSKRKGYDGTINENVTWRLDEMHLKPGYDKCIILNRDTGNLTLKKDGSDEPVDFITNEGKYLVLVAESVQDPSKMGKVKINISEDGAYPVSITTGHVDASNMYSIDEALASKAATKNYEAGTLDVQLSHVIKYTRPIDVPGKKGETTDSLSGDAVFDRVSYVSVVDENGKDVSQSVSIIKGKIVFVQSNVNHTYSITARVGQKDQLGQNVESTFKIQLRTGDVPNRIRFTKPILIAGEEADRGADYGVLVRWTEGVPTVIGDDWGDYAATGVQMEVFYEWSIDDANNSCNNWQSDVKNNFARIVSIVEEGGTTSIAGDKKSCVTGVGQPSIRVNILPYLDWNKTYTFRVNVRAILENPASNSHPEGYVPDVTNYYKTPTTDEGTDIFTTNPDSAYVLSTTVTIKPVELVLEPINKKRFGSRPDMVGVFNTSDTVALGEKTQIEDGGPFKDLITGKDRRTKINYDYYKVFRADLKGLSLSGLSFVPDLAIEGISTYDMDADPMLADGTSALTPYYYMRGVKYWTNSYVKEGDTPKAVPVEGFDADLIRDNNMNYFYLKITPAEWYQKTATFPVGCKYTCNINDSLGNRVKARFRTAGDNKTSDFVNYNVLFKYEGEY